MLFFLASIGTAFVIYSVATTVNYKRLRLEGIEKTVAFETEKVNRIIAELERGAIFYAAGGMLCYETQSEEFGERLAVEYISSFPAAVGGGFWFEPYAFKKDKLRAGFYAFRDNASGEVKIDNTFLMDEYDYHNKSWYRETVDSISRPYQVAWTRPYTDDSGTFSLMTTASSGVFDKDGKLIAMSTVDWEIEEVVKQLIAVKPSQNSFVLLCVPEKDYVIFSTRTQNQTGASIKSVPWDINADSFTLDGVRYMRFGRYMDNGWLLSVQIPENEIFAEVERQNLRFSVIFALAAVLMLLLAYFLVSKFINAPIKQLTQDVSNIALGNLDTRIEITSRNELGLLAQTFNKMTGDLKKSIEENERERAKKERTAVELSVAAEIQASMMPCVFPPFPDRKEFDIFASMVPAKEVGGDFYDFYFIDKDNLVVVMADVSGKGVPAALFMVVAKTLIKNCSKCRTPKAVFDTVNEKLCEGNDISMFVTAIAGFYNIPTGRFVFVNAGHNPPLLKRKGSPYEFLKTVPCPVLAFLKDTKYREEEIFLESGDVLFFYTDGVTEAMNGDREMFGEQRLLSAANRNRGASVNELLKSVKGEVDNFADGAEQADDITMLALKICGGNEEENADNDAPEQLEAVSGTPEKLELEAKIENLDKLTGFVNARLEKGGYSPDFQNEINIAVEEIFMNIVNYAYIPASGMVSVSVSCEEKAVIKFEDSGRPYNPLTQPDPELDKPPAEREIGGLGVFFVKKTMDSVEYSRVNDKNILVIAKAR